MTLFSTRVHHFPWLKFGKRLPAFLIVASLILSPCGAFAANSPSASIAGGCLFVEGRQYKPIESVETHFRISGARFSVDPNYDVEFWFPNLPSGLSVKVKTVLASSDYTLAVLEIKGTPTVSSNESIIAYVPSGFYQVYRNGQWVKPDGDIRVTGFMQYEIAPAAQPNSGEFLLDKLILGMGKSVKAYNIVDPNYSGNITWKINDESVIKVAGNGKNAKIVPLKPGSALLIAIYDDSTVATMPVTVVESGKAVNKLTLTGSIALKANTTKKLNYTVGPFSAADMKLKWFTTDKAITMVDQSGTIRTLKKGKCKIYALTTSGIKKVVNVTVK